MLYPGLGLGEVRAARRESACSRPGEMTRAWLCTPPSSPPAGSRSRSDSTASTRALWSTRLSEQTYVLYPRQKRVNLCKFIFLYSLIYAKQLSRHKITTLYTYLMFKTYQSSSRYYSYK